MSAANKSVPHPAPFLVTPERAAEILGTTPGTLGVWRCTRKVMIPYVKVGRSVRYDPADLQRYIDSRRVGTIDE